MFLFYALSVLCTLFSPFAAAIKTEDNTDLLFLSDCLWQHNYYRRLHSAPEVSFDVDLIRFANERAKAMAVGNITDIDDQSHDDLKYGVNSAWNIGSEQVNCRSIVDLWYREVKFFNFKKILMKNRNTNHFTQLVWKSTDKIGCSQIYADSPIPGVYTVCAYYPKGNIKSEMKKNVLRQKENNRSS
ncbi:hypothetical protein B4U79_00425 [Dinothrombium tinctorium]|uniref:SCP domain-containing protein n=1 Tax=Dinothrombium tinctorium TaxID=1965070 RepID=A0A443QWD9_9ACAR|nr:hypothetical protein B4U79_00425 [Dinothrombium tinctorium]